MAKKTFKVEITETLQRTIKVNAEDESEAIELVKQDYRDCKIVMGSEDYIDTDFDIVED